MENNKQKYDFPTISMNIIMPAGNARFSIEGAMEALLANDYETADAKLKEAKEFIKQAHAAQTDVLQELARDEYEGAENPVLPMLFIHAQDTIMTIMSEVNVFEQMYSLYRKLEKEIKECKK